MSYYCMKIKIMKKAKIKVWFQASMITVFLLFSATSFAQDHDTLKNTQESTETTIKKDTVTDIDGNVYTTVTIGTQVWMAENLKTTKYNDGTKIPNVTDNNEWKNLSSAAYCWYNNDINNGNIYGALYNWHAINTGKLCPAGWHVPTDSEWTELIDYLGGKNVAGGKLKETNTTHWKKPNTGATNETCFTALPGGNHNFNGYFDTIDSYGLWWSVTEYEHLTNNAWYRRIIYNGSNVYRSYGNKDNGFSVRCVRD